MIFVFHTLIFYCRILKTIEMKKIFILLLPLIFLIACGVLKTVTVERLQLGMNRSEVEDIFGGPQKVLIVGMTEYGRQEILAYKIGNDIYVLEFMDDQLIRYEFLREDVVYVPPPPPPSHRPFPVQAVSQPIRPTPVDHPQTTRPTPTADSGKTKQEEQHTESQSRRPNLAGANQKQAVERDRPATSEANRRDRGNVDAGRPSRNSRSSEENAKQ